MYFSGRSSEFFRNPNIYGLMLSYRDTGGQKKALNMGCCWMLDNGAFSGNFDEQKWINRLERFSVYANTCKGVIAPDAVILNKSGQFQMGDWYNTREKLKYYSPIIRSFGLPVAYALQDNHPIEEIPWNLFDVLFVAGTGEWKESIMVENIAKEAKKNDISIHIGRVSQLRRFKKTWWADSWDGTTFKWEPEVKHERFKGFLSSVDEKFHQWRLI